MHAIVTLRDEPDTILRTFPDLALAISIFCDVGRPIIKPPKWCHISLTHIHTIWGLHLPPDRWYSGTLDRSISPYLILSISPRLSITKVHPVSSCPLEIVVSRKMHNGWDRAPPQRISLRVHRWWWCWRSTTSMMRSLSKPIDKHIIHCFRYMH